MESRAFIKAAGELITEINEFKNAVLSHEDEVAKGTAIQKQIKTVFTGLMNPTLPSAGKLCETALAAGFQVDHLAQQKIQQAESAWQF